MVRTSDRNPPEPLPTLSELLALLDPAPPPVGQALTALLDRIEQREARR